MPFVCRGAGWRAGGAARAPCPPFVRPGGAVGPGVALPRSVPLPSLGRQQSGCHWRRSVRGGRGPPYHSGWCSAAFTGRDLCGVLARWRGLACSPRFLWEPAAGAGGRAALRILSLAGGAWTILPASGGGGRGPRGLRTGGGGGGGGHAAASLLPLCMAARGSPPWPPSCRWRTLPWRARAVGVAGPPQGWGGMRGGPRTAPPGAPADLNPPSALPEWAVVMGGTWGARPPYCSGAPPWAAFRLGPRAAPARWCGLACRPRPPREQAAGGAGARGVKVQPHPPPRAVVPSGGGGASSRLQEGGGSFLWPSSLGGGERGGGGRGGRPPAPLGVRPPSVVSGVHPRVILVPWQLPGGRGRRARSGRPPMGQCGGGGEGGGGNPPALVRAPVFPGQASVGRQRAGRAGACLVRGAPSPRVQRPLPGRCGAAVSSVCLCPLLGLRGRGRGEWGGPSGPLAPPPDGQGGAAWRSRPRGPAVGPGVALSPRPPLPRVGPSCKPSLRTLVPPAVVARRWPARGRP